MVTQVTILDACTGNVRSLVHTLEDIGARAVLARRPEDLRHAGRLVLPGVGRFDVAMDNLNRSGVADALHEAVLIRKTPVLGICLGLQMMVSRSEEGGGRGLEWLQGTSVRLHAMDTRRHKIPHIGWNSVEAARESSLLKGVEPDSAFYFSHSYHAHGIQPEAIGGNTHYGYAFPSLIEWENVLGTQFHPEKSHGAGAALLRNFLAL